MAKSKALVPSASKPTSDVIMARAIQMLSWRLDRLERQVQTLSELVRDHAEDADRLVRIVAEDHEALRRELVQEHQAHVRARKRLRRGR
ncbi:MAG TPA: hypothetical protein VFA38_05385 [Nitrospirales bacterium]|nr:hypothetical protein [Nitrospirales bacterium]